MRGLRGASLHGVGCVSAALVFYVVSGAESAGCATRYPVRDGRANGETGWVSAGVHLRAACGKLCKTIDISKYSVVIFVIISKCEQMTSEGLFFIEQRQLQTNHSIV